MNEGNGSRWLPLVIGIVASVLMALPAALLLFATNAPFAKNLIEVIYPIPSFLLSALHADMDFIPALLALLFGQFIIYGFIVSVPSDSSNRRKVVWWLVALHAAGVVMVILYNR